MSKKKIYALITYMSIVHSYAASGWGFTQSTNPQEDNYFYDNDYSQKHNVLIEAQAAYFLSANHMFKKIYDTLGEPNFNTSGGGIYGGEVSFRVYHDLFGWASASVFEQKGWSNSGHSQAKFTFVPVGFGLKYFFGTDRLLAGGDFYLGLGALATYFHTVGCGNQGPLFKNWGPGVTVKGGFIFDILNYFFLDLFINYDYATAKNKYAGSLAGPCKTTLSGLSFGGGLGIQF